MTAILWAIVAAALIHVAEEYRGGFVRFVERAAGYTITLAEFAIINALFVVLCIIAAAVWSRAPMFSLSVAGLILVNALIHVGAVLKMREYAPGVMSAIVLYVPLGASAIAFAVRDGIVQPYAIPMVLLSGLAWHVVPPLFHGFYTEVTKPPHA